MRLLFLIPVIILTIFSSDAQPIDSSSFQKIHGIELSIKDNTDSIINSKDWFTRFQSDSSFIRGFIGALKERNSFYYPFDSLQISKIYAPDSSFRIFTWQVMKDVYYYRQRGAIQMKTADGSLKLFPLYDQSDFTTRPTDSMRDNKNWIGAVYYKIILKTFNRKNYYTLLGTDANNERSYKKWMDILTFDKLGNPQFGDKIFVYPEDEIKPPQPAYRFCLEYKKDGNARLNYDANVDAIIFDHLVSENNDPATPSTLVPYGDYEGFKWRNGKWIFTDTPFDNITPNLPPKEKLLPHEVKKGRGKKESS